MAEAICHVQLCNSLALELDKHDAADTAGCLRIYPGVLRAVDCNYVCCGRCGLLFFD